jgi:hypothetical protein
MALAEARDLDDYHLEAGKLDVHFVTPILLASMVIEEEREALEGRKKRKKKRRGQEDAETYEPGEAFYEWQKDSDNFRAVVSIQAYPEINAGGAGSLIGRGKHRFKTDFDRMELAREGEVVEPIHPGRIKEIVTEKGFKDVGYWGHYEYPPEAFASGAAVTVTIWEEDVSEPEVLVLPPDLLARIRSDLQPYFDSAGSADSAGE